jgi:two-component system, sensor histidine kinase and response regulator
MEKYATLLVVEDEPDLLLGIKDTLKLENYAVLTAANGKEALDLMNSLGDKELPDLILSDIMMPKMDGMTFLREVRKKRKWTSIPFMFLTAKSAKVDVRSAMRMGVQDYIVKPFETEDLLLSIAAQVKRTQTLEELYGEFYKEEITDVKEGILAVLSHEFRTPLTLIVAYSEMLKGNQVNQMSEDELLFFLKEVNSGADRLRHLVENFILLMEMQAGESKGIYDLRKQPVTNMAEIIQQVHDKVIVLPEVTHACTLTMPNSLPAITGHADYLVVMYRELLLNAIKFSEPTTLVKTEVEVIGDKLHIRVIDQGRGIPEEEFEKIWELFYQVNRDFFQNPGSGSGLTIAKGLTELHGGHIALESEEGQGSCFTLILPIAK